MMTSSQKLFQVLEFLCAEGPHKALEISRTLQLQKSSVHRFLNSLIEFGYVYKDPRNGTFAATLKVARLGAMASKRFNIVEASRKYMSEVLTRFNQASVSLGTLIDNRVFVLHRELPPNSVVRIDMNQELPAYCTGLGKALLSTRSKEEILHYVRSVSRTAFTQKTLVEEQPLLDAIMAARVNGYAEDVCEIHDTLHCVAVPIVTPNGGLWALSLSGHNAIIREYGVDNIVEHLKNTVREMTSDFSMA